tara:strand:+ start:1630 stop:1743 length:114 start_codon:yes stop_codon:yes gene_type:complete
MLDQLIKTSIHYSLLAQTIDNWMELEPEDVENIGEWI